MHGQHWNTFMFKCKSKPWTLNGMSCARRHLKPCSGHACTGSANTPWVWSFSNWFESLHVLNLPWNKSFHPFYAAVQDGVNFPYNSMATQHAGRQNSTHSKPIGTSLQCCSAFDLMPFHFHASSENWLCQALVMSSQQLLTTWRITEHHFSFSIRTAQQQHPFTRFTRSAR